jgi:hypothetical protein
MNVDFTSPTNSGVISYLKSNASSGFNFSKASSKESCAPESVTEPYHNLNTHPDLLTWFWDQMTTKLPEVCRWVVYGLPVLVNPKSGIIFGFAQGTHTYALRLPDAERNAAMKAGCKRIYKYSAPAGEELSLDDIGAEWIFGKFDVSEKDWCLSAYEYSNHQNN